MRGIDKARRAGALRLDAGAFGGRAGADRPRSQGPLDQDPLDQDSPSGPRVDVGGGLVGGGLYEYRVWPDSSDPVAAILQKRWTPSETERRADIYLVHPASDRVLVKLRDGKQLEIKRLTARVGTVDYWTKPVSGTFPLTAAHRYAAAAALGMGEGLPAISGTTPGRLLDALDAAIVPLTVRKSRALFRSGACRAEIGRVAIGGRTWPTVALEAPDLPALALAMDGLEIGRLPNRSYGEVLLRIARPRPVRCRPSSDGAPRSVH